MANKDHLPTPEETTRKRQRDLKRVVSTTFQGNPPVFTRSVDQIGVVAKTTGEVRDTEFPILESIDDLTDNVQTAIVGAQATITVQLDKAYAQFHRLKLDDAAGAITDFIIDFTGLAKNKALEFIADVETVFAGLPTITFQANGTPITLGGLPSAFGDTGTNNFKLDISAIDTPIIESYEVLNGASGAGGVSFPITPPVDSRGNVNTAQDIDLSLTTAHSTKMTLTGDIAITFSNIPAALTQIEWEIEIKQDGVGGHVITSWPAGVIDIPTIDTDADAVTLVALRTNDNGTTINALFSTLGTVSNVSLWANFNAVTNINAGNNDIVALNNIDFDGASSTIQGLHNLLFFQAGHSINSLSGEMDIQVAATDFIRLIAGASEIARFEDVATVLALNMQDHSVDDVKDINFDVLATFAGAGAQPTIGFDDPSKEFRHNTPASSTHIFTINNVRAVEISNVDLTFADNFTIIANPGATFAGLNVGQLAGDPSTPGNADIHYNALTNKFRFRENGAYVELGGSPFPVTDAVFQVVDDIDPTKTWQVSLAGVSTADAMLFNFSATTSRTYTFGDAAGTVVLNPMFEDLDANGWDVFDIAQLNQEGTVPTSGFINMANSAGIAWEASPAGVDGVLTYSASEHFTFTSTVGGSVLGANGQSLGLSGFRWGTLWAVAVDLTGTLTVDGTTILGDSAADGLFVNATSTFSADIGLADNDIIDVNNLFITTAAGAAVGSIRGIDAVTDNLEIRLGAAVDFSITDNGTVRASFNNTLITWDFSGSSVLRTPAELQIFDRGSNPSTPPSGNATQFVINVAGAQTLRVIFDNGTVKDIANDV